MPDEVKKRGRPPLSPEEKEARRIAKNKRDNELKKQRGYPAQVKYRAARYMPRVYLSAKSKESLETLLQKESLTLTQLFIGLVYEKYGILLEEGADDKK